MRHATAQDKDVAQNEAISQCGKAIGTDDKIPKYSMQRGQQLADRSKMIERCEKRDVVRVRGDEENMGSICCNGPRRGLRLGSEYWER